MELATITILKASRPTTQINLPNCAATDSQVLPRRKLCLVHDHRIEKQRVPTGRRYGKAHILGYLMTGRSND